MWSQGQRGGVSACVTGIGVENLAPGCWRGAAKSLPGGGGRRRREEIVKKKRREGEAWRREEVLGDNECFGKDCPFFFFLTLSDKIAQMLCLKCFSDLSSCPT